MKLKLFKRDKNLSYIKLIFLRNSENKIKAISIGVFGYALRIYWGNK